LHAALEVVLDARDPDVGALGNLSHGPTETMNEHHRDALALGEFLEGWGK
jgi:hypothetical protein